MFAGKLFPPCGKELSFEITKKKSGLTFNDLKSINVYIADRQNHANLVL